MQILETSIILGVTLGMVYALVGAGLVTIYRTSGYVSFCQGDIATVSLYVGLAGYKAGLPYWATAILVVAVGAVFAGLVGALIVVPIERFGMLSAALATVGVGLTIQGFEALLLQTDARGFPSPGDQGVLTLGPVTLTRTEVTSFIVCLVIFIALGLFFGKSRMGVAMRAVVDDRTAARHIGLSPRKLKYTSWVISGAIAGVTGLFVVPIYGLTPTAVNALLVFGFATVVFGGFDSVLGALIAGIVIGVFSNLVSAYLQPGVVDFALYILLFAVLLVRPFGLLGRRPLVRV